MFRAAVCIRNRGSHVSKFKVRNERQRRIVAWHAHGGVQPRPGAARYSMRAARPASKPEHTQPERSLTVDNLWSHSSSLRSLRL